MFQKLLGIFAALLIGTIILSDYTKAEEKFNLEKFKKSVPELLGSSNAGTKFYFSFPPPYLEAGANNSMRIYISSGVATRVVVRNNIGMYYTKTTIPNDIIEFILTPTQGAVHIKALNAFAEPERVWPGAAVIVEADDPIICYGVARFAYTTDGFLGIPASGLGKEYIVASFWDWGNQTTWIFPSYTAISAPYDQTRVRFTLGGPLHNMTAGGMKLGETQNFNMNNGDVLLIGSKGNMTDLTGSKIRATKPVAVVSGNFCSRLPENIAACDYICEMELPTNTWGTEYHVTPIQTRKKNSYVRILAKEDGTTIYRDGQYFGFIKQAGGETGVGYLHTRAADGPPAPYVFSADKPFNMSQFNPSSQDDNAISDPFQMVLTPLEQYQTEIIFCTPGITGGFGFKDNYVNIVYQGSESGAIPADIEWAKVVNGNFSWIPLRDLDPSPGLEFSIPVNGKRYFSKTYKIDADGVYKLRANSPFACYAYGQDNYDTYGFPTSVALGDLEKLDTVAPFVEVTPDCGGDYLDQEVTDMPDDDQLRVNMGAINMHSDVSFNYKFTYEDFVPGENRKAYWQAIVVDKTKDARAVITFIDKRGNDTTIVLEYTAPDLRLSPRNENYGLFSTGDTESRYFWLVNDTKNFDMEITDVYLLTKLGRVQYGKKYPNNKFPSWGDKQQNFTITLVNSQGQTYSTPFLVPKQDSVEFMITFNAATDGNFIDSVGFEGRPLGFAPQVCFWEFNTEVRAAVGNPVINVSDWDFGTIQVNKQVGGEIEIKNTGSVNLEIYGYTGPSNSEYTHTFNTDFPNVDPDNPLIIAPNEVKTYSVTFKPTTVASFPDQMVFLSNASTIDEIAVLNGAAVEPGLITNGYDWGERRIYRPGVTDPAYTGPYDVELPDMAILLENNGSAPISIVAADIESNVGDPEAFGWSTLKPQFAGPIQPGEQIHVPVTFNPQVVGNYELVIRFTTNQPGITRTSTLRGVGIVPYVITSDQDFGTTIRNDYDNANIRNVSFRNPFRSEAGYEFGDVLTINSFDLAPAGTIINAYPVGDLTTYGTEGFRYDETEQNITWPVVLNNGEEITFEVQFVAQNAAGGAHNSSITSVSDAFEEKTSNLTGNGLIEALAINDQSGTICVEKVLPLTFTITNTGTADIRVNSLGFNLTAGLPSAFEFVNPLEATNGFNMAAGATKNIVVNFKPFDMGDYIGSLVVNTDAVEPNLQVINGGINCSASDFAKTTKLSVPDEKVIIGSVTGAPIIISLDATNDAGIDLAKIKELDVVVTYNKDILRIQRINGGNQFAKDGTPQIEAFMGWTVNWNTPATTIRDDQGIINLRLVKTNGYMDNAGGDLLGLKFLAFLPQDDNDNAQVSYTIAAIEEGQTGSSECMSIQGATGEIQLMPTCVYDIRKVLVSNTNYVLESINPNPVKDNAKIKFGVAWDEQTTLKLYNSNGDLIVQPINSVIEAGNYEVDINTSNLPSGVYFYELVSANFRETKQMVVVK